MQFIDQMQRTVTLSTVPRRMVSLVPSQTELLVDLGLRNNLVGITKFCIHPINLRNEITIVGGTKQVHLDKIKALQPDIILCNKEENTLEMVEALEKIAPVWVSDIISMEDCFAMIKAFGELFQKEKNALSIIKNIEGEWRDFNDFISEKPIKKVAYLIWKNPYMVAGKNTFINTLLEINHFENSFKEREERYPEITENELVKTQLILLSSEPYPFKKEDALLLSKINYTGEVVLVDGEFFSWYGSRLAKAFQYFKKLHALKS
ncbi:MAG: cobalamin-binding protein [Bacteroidetes bacterium HGW-Bacteroidetes-2]|jgi:ABC-type Fe3+-hydroxamate transport system substrate-binding protein|nr:MAG: cobalamin-binding protein [Bacteroidetes bacterium HGW-Bacteroidetes-8]PKP26648.1 MAG: cobalamin-binding protein [Bacteroidetes bacterium HGW-Bacteroidetes-2]